MKKVLTILILFASASISIGQNQDSKENQETKDDPYAEEDLYEDDPYFWSYTKEVGLNMTPLASKFVPFNLGETDAGLVDFHWKKYYGKRAFRIGLGATLEIFDGDSKIFLSIGSERRYPISKSRKFTYSSGWDLQLFSTDTDDDLFIGAAKSYGIEYHFTKRIFLSTEASLRVGLGNQIFAFDPPKAIFLNVRLY